MKNKKIRLGRISVISICMLLFLLVVTFGDCVKEITSWVDEEGLHSSLEYKRMLSPLLSVLILAQVILWFFHGKIARGFSVILSVWSTWICWEPWLGGYVDNLANVVSDPVARKITGQGYLAMVVAAVLMVLSVADLVRMIGGSRQGRKEKEERAVSGDV